MNGKITCCTFVLGFLLSGFVHGQKRIESIQTISLKEGLSDRFVTDIEQDDKGFLWIGTYNGLNYFDGTEVVPFTDNVNSKYRISKSHIVDLALRSPTELLLKYQYIDDFIDVVNPYTFTHTPIPLTEKNGFKGKFRAFHFGRNGEVNILAEKDNEFVIYGLTDTHRWRAAIRFTLPEVFNRGTYTLLQSKDNAFYILEPKSGILKVDSTGDQRLYPIHSLSEGQRKRPLNEVDDLLYEDSYGRLFAIFRTLSGVFLYNSQTDNFELYAPLSNDNFFAEIWEDQLGKLLFSTQTEASEVEALFLLQGDKVSDYTFVLSAEAKITSVRGEDFSSLLYIGALSGVKKVALSSSNVQRILSKDIDVRNGEWGYAIHGMVMDEDQDLYIVREVENWFKYNQKTQSIDTLYLLDDQGKRRVFFCSFALVLDDEKNLWGCSCAGNRKTYFLNKYNTVTGKTTTYQTELLIYGLTKSEDQKLWMPMGYKSKEEIIRAKLVSFDPQTETFETYENADGTNPLNGRLPRFLYEDKNGGLWIGTLEGLVYVDRQKRTSQLFLKGNGTGKNILNHNEVMVVQEDSKGNILAGTRGGLNIYNPLTQAVESYDETHGLCNKSITGILSDESDNLWLSTFNGISYFDRKNKTFQNFDLDDGLSHSEFNRFGFYKSPGGKYFFGGMNGITAFYPEDLLREDSASNLYVTKVTMYDGNLDSIIEQRADLHNLTYLDINPSVTFFEINFGLNDLRDAARNQYQVQLEGVDGDWVYLGNTPRVRYNQLPSGEYILLLRGANFRGIWTEEPYEITIRVRQVFYKTWWFLTLLTLGLLGIVYYFYTYDLRQALKVERLRTKIASDLHDEVGSIMTRISMGAELLKEGVFEEEEQQEEMDHIAKQSREVTSIMSDVVWSIDARKDRVRDLLDRMREHLEELLTPAQIQYDLKFDHLPEDKKLRLNVRQNLYFIFKEAINNIVKHSNANMVNVYLDNTSRGFVMSITDNGSISKPNIKTGQGLKNMQMRADRMNAQLTISKDDGYQILLKMDGL